jgi:hypothetical protein
VGGEFPKNKNKTKKSPSPNYLFLNPPSSKKWGRGGVPWPQFFSSRFQLYYHREVDTPKISTLGYK